MTIKSKGSKVALVTGAPSGIGQAQILDPDNGKVYRSKLRLTDNGKKLSVRGYIGVPMLGRSQTWVRQE